MFRLTFDRQFFIASYSAGHGLLLLRSNRCDEHPLTRVDILFKDVWALESRVLFDGLKIEEVSPEFLEDTRSKAKEVLQQGHKVYCLTSQSWTGFIVGGIVAYCEDEGVGTTRSQLLGPEHD